VAPSSASDAGSLVPPFLTPPFWRKATDRSEREISPWLFATNPSDRQIGDRLRVADRDVVLQGVDLVEHFVEALVRRGERVPDLRRSEESRRRILDSG
jgi:hypothetical protein